ncbi:DUF4232 domain-containing protein [Streptomyces celluloflavus]|uniref:DUF4232 domain-containing protein n=1 Tax=Streptomyces celluloflavus TaxID=58344 RepID=UPI00367F0258
MNIRRTRIATAAATALVGALALTGLTAGAATAAPATAKAASPVTCTGANTRVEVSQVSRPINHLLIKATNTGKVPCHAYGAPLMGFNDPQAALPILRDSIPQAVVTLEPGQSAYAGVRTSGDGGHGQWGTKLSLGFQGRDLAGSVGPMVSPAVPKGTWVDDSATVTYWQTTAADALFW